MNAVGITVAALLLGSCASEPAEFTDAEFYGWIVACTETETGKDYGEVIAVDEYGGMTPESLRTTTAALNDAPNEYDDCFDQAIDRFKQGVDRM
jgi:hypothetical protein